jgi:hypothetical protein
MLLRVFYSNLPQRASSSLDYTSANEVVNTALHGLRGAKLWKIQIPYLFNDAVSNSCNVACNFWVIIIRNYVGASGRVII